MQLFLYMCEDCQTARFSVADKGNTYYTECVGCLCMAFHSRVLVDTIWCIEKNRIVKNESKLGFYVEEDNDTKEERKVDEC